MYQFILDKHLEIELNCFYTILRGKFKFSIVLFAKYLTKVALILFQTYQLINYFVKNKISIFCNIEHVIRIFKRFTFCYL